MNEDSVLGNEEKKMIEGELLMVVIDIWRRVGTHGLQMSCTV